MSYYLENVLGMYKVLSAMVTAGTAHILFSSSAAVYGVVSTSPGRDFTDPSPVAVWLD